MKEIFINDVIQEMIPHLNSVQIKELKHIMQAKLCGKNIVDNENYSNKGDSNEKLMILFLSSKV